MGLWKKEKEFFWEGKEALGLIKEKLNQTQNSSGPLNISIGVSEAPSVRKELQKKIENFLLSQNIPFQEVEVLCSYKQGFFWLTEKILPLVHPSTQGKPGKVKITFEDWQPHLARLELYEGVNLYAKRKSSRARRLSSRRKMTYVEETPELMDETAQGEWLDFLCEQGVAYLKAHLQYLSQARFETARVEEERRDRIHIQFIRSRPGDIK